MKVYEIDAGHLVNCTRRGATTIKVITLEDHQIISSNL